MLHSPSAPSAGQGGSACSFNKEMQTRVESLCSCLLVGLFLMAQNCMALVKAVPRGWLQTRPTEELPTYDGRPHKNQIPQHFLQGSWCFPEGLLVLSLHHSRPRNTGTVSRGHVTGTGTYSQHCHVGTVVEVDIKHSLVSAVCCVLALRMDT